MLDSGHVFNHKTACFWPLYGNIIFVLYVYTYMKTQKQNVLFIVIECFKV